MNKVNDFDSRREALAKYIGDNSPAFCFYKKSQLFLIWELEEELLQYFGMGPNGF